MRSTGIQIHAKIPVLKNSDGDSVCQAPYFRDGNNVVYQIEAIRGACGGAKNIPIIRYKADGTNEAIGVARAIEWNPDGFIEVSGVLWFGGTSEEVIFDSANSVVSMTIESVGLGL